MKLFINETQESADEDIGWVKEAQAGDTEVAVTKLYNKWKGLIQFKTNSFVSPEDLVFKGDDCFAAACMGFLEAIRTYNPEKDLAFGAWAGMQIRWAIRHEHQQSRLPDVLERGKIMVSITAESKDSKEEFDLHMPTTHSCFREVANKLDAAKALEFLSPKEYAICHAFYFQDITLEDIAEVLGVSRSRIGQIHIRSLKKMKKALRAPVAQMARAADL